MNEIMIEDSFVEDGFTEDTFVELTNGQGDDEDE